MMHHGNPAMAAAAMLSLTAGSGSASHPAAANAAADDSGGFPRLAVVKQNSLSEETYSKNGKQKQVHVVVKNSPFSVQLGLQHPVVHHPFYAPQSVDLSKVSIDIRLFYDNDHASANEKEVDYVKVKPFEFKVPQQQSTHVMVEVRLKVLSSQHEDMFFRVKFLALDPITRRELHPALQCYSEPIKVISKPEQLKKRKPSRKKTTNDMLLDTLRRIEQQQLEQQVLLDKLQEEAGFLPPGSSSLSMSSSSSHILNQHHQHHHHLSLSHSHRSRLSDSADNDVDMLPAESNDDDVAEASSLSAAAAAATAAAASAAPAMPPGPPPNFEASFQRLLTAFGNLPTPAEDRRAQARSAVGRIGATPGDTMSRLHDMFLAEGLAAALGGDVRTHSHLPPASTGAPAAPPNAASFAALGEIAAALGIDPNTPFCACTDCPHKSELEKIEGFMRQIMTADFGDGGGPGMTTTAMMPMGVNK